MIAIKIELWPRGVEARAREIGRMYIANDGAGTPDRGDYKVAVCRRGTNAVPREIYDDGDRAMIEATAGAKLPKSARAGEVKDYPRLAYNVWRLIARAALAAFPEEDKPVTKGRRARLDQLAVRGLHLLAEPLRQAMKNPAAVLALPDGEVGEALRAALEWLDAAGRDDA